MNLVDTPKNLPLASYASLAHTSLLPINSNALKLGAAQELKLAQAVNKGPGFF